MSGKHPGRISAEKIEAVYLDWVDSMSLEKLRDKHHISIKTIVKYRDENGWAERKAKIQHVVAKKVDNIAVRRQTRKAKMGVKLQAEGLKKIKGGIESEQVALNAIKLGAELEDQAYGDTDDETTTVTIKLPKGTTLGFKE